MQLSPLAGGKGVSTLPETAASTPGSRLVGRVVIIDRECSKRPGPAVCDHLLGDVTVVDPEPTEKPSILVACLALDAHQTTGEFCREGLTRLFTKRLTQLRRINADETNFLTSAFRVAAGHRVAVMHRLHAPDRSAGGFVPRAHRPDDCDDARDKDCGQQVPTTDATRNGPRPAKGMHHGTPRDPLNSMLFIHQRFPLGGHRG